MKNTDKPTLRLADRLSKANPLLKWLFFLGGVCIASVSAAIDLPGGLFVDKAIILTIRFLAIVVLFALLSFRFETIRFASSHSSWWEALISFAFALYQGGKLGLTFYRVFFATIAQGEAPVIAQRVYDAIPVPGTLKLLLIYVALALVTLLVIIAFLFLALCIVRLLRKAARETFHNLDYPDPVQLPSLGRRILYGALLAGVTAVFCFFTLNKGQEWGADYTVYIQQAIDLASGQAERINVVWGFGAMLVPIYLLFGYDRVDFSSVIYYKIPGAICLTLLVFFLFLFFSKRFRTAYAAVLTALFGIAPTFVSYTNEILTNIPHMLFSTLAIICLYEMFEQRSLTKEILFAVLAGITIGISDLIRINGIVLVLTLACVHVICLISWLLRKNRFFDGLNRRVPVRHIAVHVLPYLIYFVFVKGINALVFTDDAGLGAVSGGISAGANVVKAVVASGSAQGVSFTGFFDAVRYYWLILTEYIDGLTPFGIFGGQILFLFVPLILIGMIRSFRKELISVVYFFGTMAMLCVIPYRQGIRYLFPVLPMLVLFFAVGIQTFFHTAIGYTNQPKLMKGILRVAACLLCADLLLGVSYNAATNMQQQREFNLYSFSEDAKDIYRYLIQETDEDAVVIFVKPPVVELNAERDAVSAMPAELTHDTYLLITEEGPKEPQMTDASEYGSVEGIARETGFTLELAYSNPRFQLYRISE